MPIKKVAYETVYNYHKRTDRTGKASVHVKAYQNGKRLYRDTGIRLKPEEWDERKNEVKKRPDLNRLIRDLVSAMERFELNFSAHYNRPFQLEDFKLMDTLATPGKDSITFTSFALEQIDRDRAVKSINGTTQGRYKRVFAQLADHAGKPSIDFSDLTYTLVESFDHHLRTVERLKPNYVYKYHQVIKKYLTKAIKKGLFELKTNPYNDFRPKKVQVESLILLPTEIESIERLEFSQDNEHLAFYRDAFLLAYYTLLRIGDITSIKVANIQESKEGLWLELKAQKTGKVNRLPLYYLHASGDGPSKPEQIIRRYWRDDKRPLFARSHQKMNEYIKVVVRQAGIDKPVKFHTARHSGCTFLSTILPTSIVQQLAQHSSIKTTQGYLHISGTHIVQALEQIKWK